MISTGKTQAGLTTSISSQDKAKRRAQKQFIAQRVNELFDEFRLRCRNWHQYIPDNETLAASKGEYVRQLLKNNIRDWSVMQRACEHICSEIRWYQQPDDFIAVCLNIAAGDCGLPTEEESLNQVLGLCRGEIHPAVIYTRRQMDTNQVHKLNHEDGKAAKARWRKYWKDTIKFVVSGGEIKTEKKLEQEPEKPALSKEESLVRLKKLKQELSLA